MCRILNFDSSRLVWDMKIYFWGNQEYCNKIILSPILAFYNNFQARYETLKSEYGFQIFRDFSVSVECYVYRLSV